MRPPYRARSRRLDGARRTLEDAPMKAVTFAKPLPIDHPDSLQDSVVEAPVAGPRDLLVVVRAISVNPVDTKVRSGGGRGTHRW